MADGREVVRRRGAANAVLTPAPVCLAHDPRGAGVKMRLGLLRGLWLWPHQHGETHEGLDEAAGPSLFQDTD